MKANVSSNSTLQQKSIHVTTTLEHPLLSDFYQETNKKVIYKMMLNPAKHWVLSEHVLAELPTFPGTACLEVVRAAFTHYTQNTCFKIHEMVFVEPLRIDWGVTKEAWLVFEKQVGRFDFQLVSKTDISDNDEPIWKTHAMGQLECLVDTMPPHYDVMAIRTGCNVSEAVLTTQRGEYSQNKNFIEFGPRWSTISIQINLGHNECLALFKLDENFLSDLKEYRLHPALFDVAAGYGLAALGANHIYVPLSYENICIYDNLPCRFYSHARLRSGHMIGGTTTTLQVTFIDEQGRGVVDIGAYTLRRLDREIATHLSSGAKIAAFDVTKIDSIPNGPKQKMSNIKETFATSNKAKISTSSKDDIFRRRSKLSPAKQALLEKRLQGGLGGDSQNLYPRYTKQSAIPLSYAQHRLWFFNQLDPNSALYNEFFAVRFIGLLNVTALEQSINAVIRRHEILRTTFAKVNEQIAQIIAQTLVIPLSRVDLRGLCQARREIEMRRLALEDAHQPFNLAHGPLVRVKLLQLDGEEHVLLLTAHHIICDGWSLGILMQDITAFYRSLSFTGKSPPLPELPLQYANFALWQREWLQGEVLEKQLAYWKECLNGMPMVLELPTDRPRPSDQSFRGAYYPLVFPVSLTESLRVLSQQEKVTLFMTLLAAFKILLSYHTGQEDIVVGSPIAGRNRAEYEMLVGLFLNTLVLRTDLSGNPRFREFLGRVCEVAVGAYAHQDLPFDMLVETLRPKRDLSRMPLVQVMFDLQNGSTSGLVLPGLTLDFLGIDPNRSRFDLAMTLMTTKQELKGKIEYSTDLFDVATIIRISKHFETILHHVVAQPDIRLNTLKEILAEIDKQQRIIKQKEQKEANLQKLKKVRRKSIRLSTSAKQ